MWANRIRQLNKYSIGTALALFLFWSFVIIAISQCGQDEVSSHLITPRGEYMVSRPWNTSLFPITDLGSR